MVKILFTCHVEPQRQTSGLDYLNNFLKEISLLGKPVQLHLTVGENAGDRVLIFFKQNMSLVPRDCLLGLHVHGGNSKTASQKYFSIINTRPKIISYGHWSFSAQDINDAASLGVTKDYSWVARKKGERFFVKDPFHYYGVTEYPVVCDPWLPVNPFTSWFHFCLYFLIIARYLFSQKTLHFSFHSFDKLSWRAKLVFGLPLKYVSL